MSQNIITLADLLENVELGGGSVITSITEQEPAAGPHASVAPPKFVDGKGSDSKSVFAFETRYIVEKPEDQDEPEKEEESKTAEKVVEVQKYGREPISLHTPLGEDGDSEFGDLIEDSEAVVPADAVSFTLLQEQLHSVLDTLSEREAGVVAMRFGMTDGQPKTLDEIGKVYGVTRERIRQIESKTMSKLRHPSRSQVLRDYLD